MLHFDGAPAWPSAIKVRYKHKKFRVRKVVHKKMEFVKKCRRVRLPRTGSLSASLTGTQSIDSTWRTVKYYTSRVKAKTTSKSLNVGLYDAVYEWVWWANRPNQDGFAACGQLVARWRAREH